MGLNLFDNIKLGLLNLQTSIELSSPMISLSNWADEACERNSGTSSSSSCSVSRPSTSSTEKPLWGTIGHENAGKAPTRTAPLWGNLNHEYSEPKSTPAPQPEPKKEEKKSEPKKVEEKKPESKKEKKHEEQVKSAPIVTPPPKTEVKEATSTKKVEHVEAQKVDNPPKVTPIEEQRQAKVIHDVVNEFTDDVMNILKKAAKDMADGDEKAEKEYLDQIMEGFNDLDEDSVKYILMAADEKQKNMIDTTGVEVDHKPAAETPVEDKEPDVPVQVETKVDDKEVMCDVAFDSIITKDEGFHIDLNKYNEAVSQVGAQPQVPVSYQQPLMGVSPVGPVSIPQQPEPAYVQNPNPGSPDRKPRPIEPRNGEFAVDEVKPMSSPKAKEPECNIDIEGQYPIEITQKSPKVKPPIINNDIEAAEPEPPKPRFDNSKVYHEFKYMKRIEEIALFYDIHLQMVKRRDPNGKFDKLITVYAYNLDNTQYNQLKSFTIDTGAIISRRIKMFPGVCSYGFENMDAYPVFLENTKPKGAKGNKETNNQLNEKLFDDWFTGGHMFLEDPSRGHKPMYSDERKQVNMCVSLISTPTNKLNQYERRNVWNIVTKMYRAGIFATVREQDPALRFRFVPEKFEFVENNKFVLSSKGVPSYYDGPIESFLNVEIHYDGNNKEGNTTIVYPDLENAQQS